MAFPPGSTMARELAFRGHNPNVLNIGSNIPILGAQRTNKVARLVYNGMLLRVGTFAAGIVAFAAIGGQINKDVNAALWKFWNRGRTFQDLQRQQKNWPKPADE
eukprot:gnl/Spiro4/27278_TR13573_c0_g1_i1.p2 gnl/Spiro4/27278_TR13573_c0_g1~~gnl/Spiro4/27278_TR13573_c0_g1_i1.p2  ORF type:complete len:104 (-),score=23.28 gnl/Spiro4/27278_TR13573_c0_g1_i1:113-424(-)